MCVRLKDADLELKHDLDNTRREVSACPYRVLSDAKRSGSGRH